MYLCTISIKFIYNISICLYNVTTLYDIMWYKCSYPISPIDLEFIGNKKIYITFLYKYENRETFITLLFYNKHLPYLFFYIYLI